MNQNYSGMQLIACGAEGEVVIKKPRFLPLCRCGVVMQHKEGFEFAREAACGEGGKKTEGDWEFITANNYLFRRCRGELRRLMCLRLFLSDEGVWIWGAAANKPTCISNTRVGSSHMKSVFITGRKLSHKAAEEERSRTEESGFLFRTETKIVNIPRLTGRLPNNSTQQIMQWCKTKQKQKSPNTESKCGPMENGQKIGSRHFPKVWFRGLSWSYAFTTGTFLFCVRPMLETYT